MQWDDGNERLGRRHSLDILDSTKTGAGICCAGALAKCHIGRGCFSRPWDHGRSPRMRYEVSLVRI